MPAQNINDNGDGTFTVSGLSGDSFNAYVTDSNECEILETISIEEISELEVTIEYLEYLSCSGDNAALTASIQRGFPPYEFSWAATEGGVIPLGQENSQDIIGLVAGTYTLYVTDASGCDNGNGDELEIDTVDELIININVTDITCYSDNTNGTAEVFVVGGKPPYTYIFNNSNNFLFFSVPCINIAKLVCNICLLPRHSAKSRYHMVTWHRGTTPPPPPTRYHRTRNFQN